MTLDYGREAARAHAKKDAEASELMAQLRTTYTTLLEEKPMPTHVLSCRHNLPTDTGCYRCKIESTNTQKEKTMPRDFHLLTVAKLSAWYKEAEKNAETMELLAKVRKIHNGTDDFEIEMLPGGGVRIPSYNLSDFERKVAKMTPGIERFCTTEKPGTYMLDYLGERVEFLFVDLSIISAVSSKPNEISPLAKVLKDFKPTWGNVRDGFFRAVKVGDRIWGDLPFDIKAEITEYFDTTGLSKGSTIGKVTKHQSWLFAPSGMHFRDNESKWKIGVIEDMQEIADVKHVDGAMIFDAKLSKRILSNSIAAIREDDPFREMRIAKLRSATCAIVRIVTSSGLHKGLAIFSNVKSLPGGFNIISSNENLKTNIKSTDGNIWIWAEPHVPHDEDVAVDAGSMMAHPFFFSEDDMELDMDEQFGRYIYKIENGDVTPVRTSMDEDSIASYQRRFNQVVDAGLTIFNTPYLFGAWCKSIIMGASQERRWKLNRAGKPFTHIRYDRMRWALRGSVRVQVVSNTWAKVAGMVPEGWDIKDNSVRLINGMGVVSDKTFADNYELHGGWDLDDKLILVSFLDTATNTTRLFGYRQPSSFGEYAIYDIDGAAAEFPEPCRTLNSNDFPKIDVTKLMSPEYKAANNNDWVLPSLTLEARKHDAVTLTKSMLFEEAKRSIDNPLGAYVLMIGVFYAMVGRTPFAQLGTHEQVVDAMTQASAIVDFEIVAAATNEIFAELMKETGGKIDAGLIGRVTQDKDFVKENKIVAVDGKFIRLGNFFLTHLQNLETWTNELKAHWMADLKSRTPMRMPKGSGKTRQQMAYRLNRAFRTALEVTPKTKVTESGRPGHTYAEMQAIGDVVYSATRDMDSADMNWTILAYLNDYDKADQNLSNGRMLERYLAFLVRVDNKIKASATQVVEPAPVEVSAASDGEYVHTDDDAN